MPRSSVINVLIAGDASRLSRELGTADSALGRFSSSAGRSIRAVGTAIAGLGIAAAGIAVALKPTIDAAVNQEEALNKMNTVLGDAAEGVLAWSEMSAETLGISQAEYLEAASNFAVFGKAAGLTGDDLSDFSTSLVAAAADVASFNNLTPDEALQKLRSGLSGEAEPLKSIGVLMNAAAVEAKALELGIIDVGDEMTEQQKILAREAVILEQLGSQGALGDFARTSDGLANKQRILAARFDDVKASLGERLLPAAEVAVDVLDRMMTGAEDLAETFEEEGLSGVLRQAGDAIADAWPGVRDGALDLLGQLGSWIRDTAAPWILTQLGEWGQAFMDWVGPATLGALNALGGLVDRLVDWLFTGGGLERIAVALWFWGLEFTKWVRNAIPPMMAELGQLLHRVQTWFFTDALPQIAFALGTWELQFVAWAVRMASNMPAWLALISNKIWDWAWGPWKDNILAAAGVGTFFLAQWAVSLPGQLSEWLTAAVIRMFWIGRDIVRGLWGGMNSLRQWLKDKIGGFIRDSIIRTVTLGLRIGSPSKLFEYFGEMSALGFNVGLENSGGLALDGISTSSFTTRSASSGQVIQLVVDGRVLAEAVGESNRYAAGALV